MTSASSPTASCRCRLTSLRSVEAATTSCASCGRLSGRCLRMHATKTLVPVHAFVFCRLDYCNSLFFGISKGLDEPVAVRSERCSRLITGTRRSDHIVGASSATLGARSDISEHSKKSDTHTLTERLGRVGFQQRTVV